MTLRVFIVIWGALVLTLLLFGLLVATLDLAPPKGAMSVAERDVVERQLALVAERDGIDAAAAFWAAVSPAHPGIRVVTGRNCTDAVVKIADGCLVVTRTETPKDLFAGLRILLLPLTVGFAVSAGAAFLLSQHLTRPVRTVNAALQRLAAGDLDVRIGRALHGSNSELTRLGEAFDHAAARLQTLTASQRRLFNDLSHEIRSPLARLRAAVGLLEVSPDRLPEMLRQIETDILRLDALVSDILTLARYDSAVERPAFTPIDLVDILEPILSDANFEGQTRAVAVTYDGPSSLPLSANAELLHRAIENVVRNALSHAPSGTSVSVTARGDGIAVIVEIADLGAGVPDAEKSKLGKPFFRLPNASSGVGTGLGLAIASRAIEAHGGSVRLEDNIPNGLRVRIKLRATSNIAFSGIAVQAMEK